MKIIFAGDWRAKIKLRLKHVAGNKRLAPFFVPIRNLAWAAVSLRNLLKPHEPYCSPIPVISVGNITVGGTGKTPFVHWLVWRLTKIGYRPAILTPLSENSDEAMEHESEILLKTKNCLVFPGRDRVTSIKRAIEQGATVVILDDGFQFRSLHRDVDIVLWDATSLPFSNNPFLREPLSGLKRATCIVISKADAVSEVERKSLKAQLEGIAGQGKVVAAFGYAPTEVRPVRGSKSLGSRKNSEKVLLVTGVANPLYFFLTAKKAGFDPVLMVCFPDHYRYTFSDAKFLSEIAETENADAVLTTRKDAVKLQDLWQNEIPLLMLEVRLNWLWGEEEVWRIVERKVVSSAITWSSTLTV